MANEYLVAQHLLVVKHPDQEFKTVPGEYLADGSQKLIKNSRLIQPDQIFRYEELDHDPRVAREIAEGLVNDLPEWCRDVPQGCSLPEGTFAEFAAARWANDAEVRAFADGGVVPRG